MIISASRRTDIPAFYGEWFMDCVRAGFCNVVNPFNAHHVTRVSLAPCDVDCIVFWTRHVQPFLLHLRELDERGYRYYFLYTLMGNPSALDPGMPPIEARLSAFRELAARIGPERVVWRYDPIVLSSATDPAFHAATFDRLAAALAGHTRRCVVSLVDLYRKALRRLQALETQGIRLLEPTPERLADLMPALVRLGARHDITLTSCAEETDLRPFGIHPGACIDDVLMRRLFGLDLAVKKDPAQRAACRCVVSRDIGAYDTCRFGCVYCYATR